MAKQVQLKPETNRKLDELTARRKEDNPHASKTAIVADLISKAHSKECK